MTALAEKKRPSLVAHLPAADEDHLRSGVGVCVINFNTAKQTLRCIDSLRSSTLAPDWVMVLDNASAEDDFSVLLQQSASLPSSDLYIYRSCENLGFAAGSNFLLEVLYALTDPCMYFVLLNNDAIALPEMVRLLVSALDQSEGRSGLAGGRMHRLSAPEQVDTLGITIYGSLMPANRKSVKDPYLGPTGGCCMIARGLLDRLKQASGYYFDERFFCYCEDTDLVLRSVLLGDFPAYIDTLIALHEGQASSGGKPNAFIAYHGLRNSIWMHAKLIPSSIFLKYGFFLAAAHLMLICRYVLFGRFSILRAIYRDAFSGLSEILAERKVFARQVIITPCDFERWIAPRFYRSGYFLQIVRDCVNR